MSSFADWTSLSGVSWGSARDAYGDYDPRPWDTVTWQSEGGTIKLPGVAVVSVDSKINVDVRTSANADGAQFVFQGTPPKEVSMTFTCWQPAQFEAWESILPRMIMSTKELRRSGKSRVIAPGLPPIISVPSFGFSHPVLAMNGITNMVIISTKGPTVEPAGGKFTIEISAKEWMKFEPKVYVFTADKSNSVPGIDGTTVPQPGQREPPSAAFSRPTTRVTR